MYWYTLLQLAAVADADGDRRPLASTGGLQCLNLPDVVHALEYLAKDDMPAARCGQASW